MPKSKKGLVKILRNGQEDLALDKDLILESDISLGISNDFQPLLSGGVSSALSTVSSLSGGAVSAGFRQQGFQVWRNTNPIELKLSVSLHMETSGLIDVVEPAQSLVTFAVPDLEDGWKLTPPGASIRAILGESANEFLDYFDIGRGKGWVSINIGNYINLPQCIIKNVIPTYSLQEDSEGYPTSCKLDIDISTLDVANSDMIRNLSLKRANIGG